MVGLSVRSKGQSGTSNWRGQSWNATIPALLLLLDHQRVPYGNDGASTGVHVRVLRACHHFLAYIVHELRHLSLHFLHALAHLNDDGDTGDVYAELARQRQDEF